MMPTWGERFAREADVLLLFEKREQEL